VFGLESLEHVIGLQQDDPHLGLTVVGVTLEMIAKLADGRQTFNFLTDGSVPSKGVRWKT
jgi:hypothetical protein